MNQNNNVEIDIEKFKSPLESLRRVYKQFVELRGWFTNTCLASLAFTITIFIQIRLEGAIPNPTLAQIAVGALIVSSISAIFSRFSHELENLTIDAKEFGKILPLLLDLNRNSEDLPEEEKMQNIELLEESIASKEIFERQIKGASPRIELLNFCITGVSLVFGLGALCVYIWQYLFYVQS